jgi:Ni/Co efflux regulator RcnB
MKRLILSLATAFAVAGAATGAAADPRDHRAERHVRVNHEAGRRREAPRFVPGPERRDERRDEGRDEGRWAGGDDRSHADNWQRGHHNGYFYNNRFYYGPPPEAYYSNPGYRPGYAAWRRGARLPPYYQGYVVNDYGRYRLRPPPRGYAWYRVDNDYLLASIATGVIFDIIGD